LFVESRNAKRLWTQHFGFSGFGVWRLQMPNTNTQQLLNREMRMEYGPNTLGFWGSGFQGLRIPNATNDNSQIMKKQMECGPVLFGFRGLQTPDAKHRTTSNVESRNHEKGVGPNQYQGFGIW
jgi:hypothetical protein